MKYKIVVFDLDGTILNTLEDLADSTNYALSVFDMPERTIEEIRHFVGNGIRKLMERAVPQGTPESMIVKVHETFTEHYKKHCADKTRPYDGIKELIENKSCIKIVEVHYNNDTVVYQDAYLVKNTDDMFMLVSDMMKKSDKDVSIYAKGYDLIKGRFVLNGIDLKLKNKN